MPMKIFIPLHILNAVEHPLVEQPMVVPMCICPKGKYLLFGICKYAK